MGFIEGKNNQYPDIPITSPRPSRKQTTQIQHKSLQNSKSCNRQPARRCEKMAGINTAFLIFDV